MRYDSIDILAPWCALNRIFGFAPRTGIELIRHFGGAEEVFRAGARLSEVLRPESVYYRAVNADAVRSAKEELLRLGDCGGSFVCIEDERYPELLKDCDDAPVGLYVRAESDPAEIFNRRPAVAIIGTRNLTSYGREWCTRIVSGLAAADVKPLIVSGLAIGADITAHIAALDGSLPTVAVMATGADAVYPFRHGWAADRIRLARGSGLITDYPLGTSPQAVNFIRRNRIIAGMCGATILIESGRKGGGLMTCRLAFSYNRDVYALPGRIDDEFSAGCNSLIKAKMAEPVIDIPELVRSLGLGVTGRRDAVDIRKFVFCRYRDTEGTAIAEKLAETALLISRRRDITIDGICGLTGRSYREVSGMVGRLEIDGIIVTDLAGGCCINPKII